MKSVVSIVKTVKQPDAEAVEAAVRRAIELVGGIDDIVPEGGLVLINPNVAVSVTDPEGNALTSAWTSPDVSRAIAKVVKERGAHPVIAESSAVGADTEESFRVMGYHELRDEGFEVVDLKRTKKVKVACPQGKIFKDMTTYELVMKADAVISVPVMKTHDQAEATLSLKNLKGLYTDAMKRRAHKLQLFQQVADWATVVRPKLAVVDGILGQEGLGPVFGIPKEMDLIVAGKDLVAVDAVTASVMGFEPKEVGIIKEAASHGLGTMNLDEIEVVGSSIESVRSRFMRAFEDRRTEIEGFRLIWAPETCTGCRNTVTSSVFDAKFFYGLEKELSGITVVVGDAPVPDDVPEGKLVTVGNCCPKNKRVGRFVPGCPPNNVWVVEAMVNHQLSRVYATDGSVH